MIDLHSHILPGLDDGAPDLDTALEMARLAVADGTSWLACTPHVTPGVYDNSARTILDGVTRLQRELDRHAIPLRLVAGCDFHICDDMAERLRTGSAPTLFGTRYFLFEPPHNIMPPAILGFAREIMAAGYRPILTHPERLKWIEEKYGTIAKMNDAGIALQLTAGSLTGEFGERAKYWSERMLEEERVALIASDAHDCSKRPPGLSRARDIIVSRAGDAVATHLTVFNPASILRDLDLPARGFQQDGAERVPAARRVAPSREQAL